MDYTRITKLHNKVFSTPRNSPEREQAINSLSEAERAAVFSLEKNYMLDTSQERRLQKWHKNQAEL